MNEPALSPPASPEKLLADHAWARRLARRLVRDAALADDLAQEACVRALEHPPKHDLRAWLGGVVRNLARSERRARGRRVKREELAAESEALPSAADALARLSVQQGVVRAVLALEEPYRSTIVLRFYEDLPPRKIAARAGVPVATVKTRLARGLAQLRAALDREHGGDGRAWALFLLPLAKPPSGIGPLPTGSLTMNLLAKTALVAAALVLGLWLLHREPHRATAPPAPPEIAAAELVFAKATLAAPEIPAAERASEAPLPSAPPPTLPAVVDPPIRGRVLDVTGAGVGGVELGLRGWNGSRLDVFDASIESAFGSLLWTEPLDEDAPALAVSAADGSFVLSTAGRVGRIVAVDPRWESVRVPIARTLEGHEPVLLVAPRIRVAGTVRDATGRTLSDVEVRFGVPSERLRESGANLEDTDAPDWGTTTDAAGRFELARLPAVPGAKLRARLEPYEAEVIERESWTDDEVELVMERAPGAWLEGVVEAAGAPVAEAVVALGTSTTTADSRGAFQLHLAGLEREHALCAAGPGFLPTRIEGDVDADGTVRWPAFVRVELRGETLALSGVVLDADDRPIAEQEVWLAAGRVVLHDRFPFLLESVLAGQRDARLGTKTDASGHFELRGLEAHEYSLKVVDPATGLVLDAGPFVAGRADVRVVRPRDALWPVVRGVVVTRSGAVLAGVSIGAKSDYDLVGVLGSAFFGFQAEGARTETGADGVFELHDVPRAGAVLQTWSMNVIDPEFPLSGVGDPLDLRVVVERWAALEVRVGTTYAGANAFTVLDEAEHRLEMEVPASGGTNLHWREGLTGGRAPIVKVSERAAFVVLYRDAAELARQAVVPRVGEPNRVDF